MSNRQILLALVAYAGVIANNPLLGIEQRKKEFNEFQKLWLNASQKVRDQFIKGYPGLFETVDDYRFKLQHPNLKTEERK